MEVDEKPTEEYSDIGGCDKQINELIEAVVLPMTFPRSRRTRKKRTRSRVLRVRERESSV